MSGRLEIERAQRQIQAYKKAIDQLVMDVADLKKKVADLQGRVEFDISAAQQEAVSAGNSTLSSIIDGTPVPALHQ